MAGTMLFIAFLKPPKKKEDKPNSKKKASTL
jgi:hypothetical protein